MSDERYFADELIDLGGPAGSVQVKLSTELVRLLSEQLYQSPLKAIEELVVNAYDAGAQECKVYVPEADAIASSFIAVFDNGIGMNEIGMQDLWQIGRSQKRTAEYELRVGRKQIGKFGIGKLATYTIANRLTYLSRSAGCQYVLGVTINFNAFEDDSSGQGKAIDLPVRRISDPTELLDEPVFRKASELIGIEAESLLEPGLGEKSWTIAILEDLKNKAWRIRAGRLRWVLRTAMPLRSDFLIFLNNKEVVSSKEDLERVVEFSVGELTPARIEALSEKTQEDWSVVNGCLSAASFPEGVCGTVMVTERSLHAGKSEDLGRSHGFFIRVRGRLVNEEDPLFGLSPLSYKTFNRFRADLEIDDLDAVLTAPREGVEESQRKETLEHALTALFYEARERYDEFLEGQEVKEKRRKEQERNFVNPRLVEHPVADVLGLHRLEEGAEPDETWFYLKIGESVDTQELIRQLYSPERVRYEYKYAQYGRSARMVVFHPDAGTFFINEDHDFVLAHIDNPRSQILLEDMVTAEALLEVYLRESGFSPHAIGEVLEKRDTLLRSLAKDHPFSLRAIAASLRDAANDENDLEIALVTAARALGFVAKQISGGGEPDGLARLREYPGGEKKLTLEAKSSGGVPTLASLDFAGLAEHRRDCEADGCLLVAPAYPGESKGEASAVSDRAREDRISCWTVADLARVVENAEARQITAQQVLDIVLSKYAPAEVRAGVAELLETPTWEGTDLYRAVLDALAGLEGRLPDSPRTVDLVAAEVSREVRFRDVQRKEVERALRDLAATSQGALSLRDSLVRVNTSTEELQRRLAHLTSWSGHPRRRGRFRAEE